MTKQMDRCTGRRAVSGRRSARCHYVDVLTLGELELDAFEFAVCSSVYVCRNFTLKNIL